MGHATLQILLAKEDIHSETTDAQSLVAEERVAWYILKPKYPILLTNAENKVRDEIVSKDEQMGLYDFGGTASFVLE